MLAHSICRLPPRLARAAGRVPATGIQSALRTAHIHSAAASSGSNSRLHLGSTAAAVGNIRSPHASCQTARQRSLSTEAQDATQPTSRKGHTSPIRDVFPYMQRIQHRIRDERPPSKSRGTASRPSSSTQDPKAPVDQSPSLEVRNKTMHDILDILTEFETKVSAGEIKFIPEGANQGDLNAEEPSNFFQGPLYNAVLRSALSLQLPDMVDGIFERLLKATQEFNDSNSAPARLPVHKSTFEVIMRGYINNNDPMAAFRWLSKLNELNLASPSSSQTEGTASSERYMVGDIMLANLANALNKSLPSRAEWKEKRTELDTLMDAISKVIGQVGSDQQDLDSASKAYLRQAKSSIRQYAQFKDDLIAREEAVQKQPWKDASLPLLRSSPSAAQAESSVPTSPASSDSPPENGGLLSSLPPVQLIDVNLGNQILGILRPQRFTPKLLVDGVEEALAKIREKVAMGAYPPPQSVNELMLIVGRQHNLAPLNELYAIALASIAEMNADPKSQADAWFELEDHTLRALAHAGETDAALERKNRMIEAGQLLTSEIYGALIASAEGPNNRDTTAAEELFEEAKRLDVPRSAYLYNTMMSKLTRAGRFDEVVKLFEEMRSTRMRLNAVSFSIVINACAKKGDRRAAYYYFGKMEKRNEARPRLAPYNAMIQFLVQTKDRAEALSFHKKMLDANVKPSEYTYKLLLDAYGNIEPFQPANVETVFEELRNAKGCSINDRHWASLVYCYGVNLKDMDKAIQLYKQSSEALGPQPTVFKALLTAFINANRPDLVRQYVGSMTSSGLPLGAYVCNVALRGLALDGSAGLAEARSIFEQMPDSAADVAVTGDGAEADTTTTPSSPSPAAPAPSDSDSSAAMKVTSFARVPKNSQTYETMIRVELSQGNVEAAKELVGRMEARSFSSEQVLGARRLLEESREHVLTSDLDAAAAGSV
ncbi:unnamed protein product [Tilletia controversa]|nr:unnamed protein product [Tilletia controversa]